MFSIKGASHFSMQNRQKLPYILLPTEHGDWHMCESTIYRDCTETCCHQDEAFHGRPWLDQDKRPGIILHVATTVWFRRDRVNVLDWPACSLHLSPIENVWLIMKRRIRQRHSQTAEHLKS